MKANANITDKVGLHTPTQSISHLATFLIRYQSKFEDYSQIDNSSNCTSFNFLLAYLSFDRTFNPPKTYLLNKYIFWFCIPVLQLDRSPLHIAAEKGFTQIVELLVDKFRANISARTKDGSTLMHIASQYGHPETAMVFLKKGVPLHMPNKVRIPASFQE